MIEALLGALVGGLISGLATWWHAARTQNRRNEAVCSAIGAEVSTLVTLARANDYARALRLTAQLMENKDGGATHGPIIIPAEANYFAVFDANAGDVGHLPQGTTARTIAFYQVTRSWLESLGPATERAQMAMPPDVRADFYREMADRLDRLCDYGDGLVTELATPAVQNELDRVQFQITGA